MSAGSSTGDVPSIAAGAPPVVHLYTVCWDEADMLGFFFRHYDPWVSRYVVYDDGSTDGSREILARHPRVELRSFDRTDPDSFVLSHKTMQDQAWKESRGTADWICITAIDEHLHAGGRPMGAVLAQAQASGVTLLPALGFDMNHPDMPDDAGLLVERVTRGRPRSAFNKLSLFRPAFVAETGFGPGRHNARPVGDLVVPPRDTVRLWHYKHLGFERNAAREAAQALRLGTTDVAKGYGEHYQWSKERLRGFWDEMERESVDLAAPGPDPDRLAVRPLWWEERGDIRRQAVRPPPPAEPRRDPTVSVLIKSYNHAAYIGRTLESVLEQSFQDFEIVVTDDGSTDGTPGVVERYADPRISLACSPENRGISAAMNATIARARGRYLAILNSDDWALPDRLARQVAVLDARPDLSLVFGMPQPVDESGAPAASFSDFSPGLEVAPSTADAWLRHFFYQGNCLCAPTAMIRRQAYDAAGPYDPRLTNMQDLDMWVRMAAAGHAIHVLPEAFTAFRIRAGNANMSAPRPDTYLRCQFERTRILRRYADLPPHRFEAVFGPECPETLGLPVPLRVAELALGIRRPAYQNAAVELLYEHARTARDFLRLRDVSGTVDALGTAALSARNETIAALQAALAARDQGASAEAAEADHRRTESDLDGEVSRLEERLAAAAAEGQHLREHLSLALASRERMRQSLSWRSTAGLRWIGRALKRLNTAGAG